jgi:hypothetical protein
MKTKEWNMNLEIKGELQIRGGIRVGFTNFIYTKKPTNNCSLQG